MYNTRLEQLREENELTKKKLSQILSISDSIYSRWENGKDVIPTKRLYQLANFYNINIDYLLHLTNTKEIIHSDPNINMDLVSSRIREIRSDFNETLKGISQKFDMAISTWSAYENGTFLILGIFLIEICEKTNYSADWLLGRTNKKYR